MAHLCGHRRDEVSKFAIERGRSELLGVTELTSAVASVTSSVTRTLPILRSCVLDWCRILFMSSPLISIGKGGLRLCTALGSVPGVSCGAVPTAATLQV